MEGAGVGEVCITDKETPLERHCWGFLVLFLPVFTAALNTFGMGVVFLPGGDRAALLLPFHHAVARGDGQEHL